MSTQTSMLHVRVNNEVKAEAAKNLEHLGLSLSDAVRILLTRIAREGTLPPGLIVDGASYDEWFHAKVMEALESKKSRTSHKEVMDEVQAIIDRKNNAQA
ncbi:type II toxin-antitoxin system RelB/DinJ family antitoxin [Desulfococcaceae bacterium OttesenSCG-928-F15]|nr:type II toxin-antitoxin system RelB/DinJ family antitoxin [Desulfococcaceae bacterium OttesenSCG-928-F15]